jgi:hypothetical protein
VGRGFSYIRYNFQKTGIDFYWKGRIFESKPKAMKPRFHLQSHLRLSHRLRQTVVLVVGGLVLLALVLLSFLKQYQMEDNEPPVQQPVPVQPPVPKK